MKLFETFRKNPLVLLAALVQSGAFALAGSVYFGLFGWVLGAMAGIVVNLSLALAASRVADIAGKRKPMAYTSLVALMLLSPIAVAPAEYALLTTHVSLAQELCIVLSVVWSTLPDWAILAAGGVVGKALVTVEPVASAIASKPEPQPKKVAHKLQATKIDKAQLLIYLHGQPAASDSAIARNFGVSRQAIAGWRKKLTPQELGLAVQVAGKETQP
jgi:hypothetical protein